MTFQSMNLERAAAIAAALQPPVAPKFPLAPGEARMCKLRKGGWHVRVASADDLAGELVDVTMNGGGKQRVRLTEVKFPATADNPIAVWAFRRGSS